MLRTPARASLQRVRLPSGVAAWITSQRHQARAVLDDPRFRKRPAAVAGAADSTSHYVFRHMLTFDPPEHTRLRAMVARDFVQRRIREHRATVQLECDRLIARLCARRDFDLLAEFARPLSLATICSVVGLPGETAAHIERWTRRITAADLEDPALLPAIAEEVAAYIVALFKSRSEAADETVFGRLSRRVRNGEMTLEELCSMTFLLVSAGHETSANLIGNGVYALLTHRAQWRALTADPSRIAAAVEELLRYAAPLEMATPRYAACDIRLDGQVIREGEMILVGLGAANRDASCFADPQQLRIDRGNADRHLSFGHGAHYCLGAQLARLEGEIAIRSLTSRLPGLRLDETRESPQWSPGVIMRGLTHLPVVHAAPDPPL